MNKFIETMITENELTYNGALTNSTSLNNCLDLFFLAGACRSERVQNIEAKLTASYVENKIKTLKIIFWAGDIRQGAGERRFFKIALNWLNENHRDDLEKYLGYIPEYSRWDVLFELENEKILDFICENINKNALLCKWLPRKNQYNNLAQKIQKKLNLTSKQYRKLIVSNTKVVEQQMCAKEWSSIEYKSVPSVAINKYNAAWYRNDKERFEKYIEDVKQDRQKINTSVIFPHDIIRKNILAWNNIDDLNEAQIAQWNNLPNYLEGGENSIIPVCDVSGSMMKPSKLPMSISLALGLYISERNQGCFKDAFITFSENPQMNYLKGNINERLKQIILSEWGMNTDFVKVFELILNKAISNNLMQEDIPEAILVISDMEFDEAYSGKTNFKHIKELFEENGYKLPNIVFWNVNGRVGNLPITVRDENVALISGASPSIIKAVLTNDINPIKIMDNVIESDRYSFIQ